MMVNMFRCAPSIVDGRGGGVFSILPFNGSYNFKIPFGRRQNISWNEIVSAGFAGVNVPWNRNSRVIDSAGARDITGTRVWLCGGSICSILFVWQYVMMGAYCFACRFKNDMAYWIRRARLHFCNEKESFICLQLMVRSFREIVFFCTSY